MTPEPLPVRLPERDIVVQVCRGTGWYGRRPAKGVGLRRHREACRGVDVRRSNDVSGVLDVLVNDAVIKLSMGDGED